MPAIYDEYTYITLSVVQGHVTFGTSPGSSLLGNTIPTAEEASLGTILRGALRDHSFLPGRSRIASSRASKSRPCVPSSERIRITRKLNIKNKLRKNCDKFEFRGSRRRTRVDPLGERLQRVHLTRAAFRRNVRRIGKFYAYG